LAREDLQGQVGKGGYSDFEFTVTDAWFGKSEAFEAAKEGGGPPTIFCQWVGDVEGLEGVPNLTEDGFHPSFELAVDWDVINDGKSVKYVGSGKERFGKWYGRMVGEVFDFTQDIPEGQHPFDGDSHPRDAQNWVGTKWFMVDKEYDFGRLGKTNKLMPAKFLGSGNAGSATVTAAATATPAGDANDGLRGTVEALAMAHTTYAEFQKAALAVPGVAQDTALVVQIADQTDNGIYATVRS
jgi:hypothetical protein